MSSPVRLLVGDVEVPVPAFLFFADLRSLPAISIANIQQEQLDLLTII